MTTKVERTCENCTHWSRHVCLDASGKPVERKDPLSPDQFWHYEECKKNWGLPRNAYTNAKKCHLFKSV